MIYRRVARHSPYEIRGWAREGEDMNILESFRIALRSLGANKLRAGLTMLGVIIGVAAVIALVSIGRGASASITAQIQSIGTNLLFVRPGSTQQGGVASAQGSAAT